MDFLDAVQWPAMLATLAAAWFVGSQSAGRRNWGFGFFITSNLLWILWGWQAQAYALIVLQIGLFALNLRGLRKSDQARRRAEAGGPIRSRGNCCETERENTER